MKMQVLDAIGVSVFFAASVLPVGCLRTTPLADLQPFVAAAGQYSLSDLAAPPTPKPAVCENCGGKGVVGDGRIEVPCPVCRPAKAVPVCSCPCGGKGYLVRSDGGRVVCPCPTSCSCKCKDGKCPVTPPTAR
jgi:hypothetical protein